jgi:hypothetical protein
MSEEYNKRSSATDNPPTLKWVPNIDFTFKHTHIHTADLNTVENTDHAAVMASLSTIEGKCVFVCVRYCLRVCVILCESLGACLWDETISDPTACWKIRWCVRLPLCKICKLRLTLPLLHPISLTYSCTLSLAQTVTQTHTISL